jgi:hypothetical protein
MLLQESGDSSGTTDVAVSVLVYDAVARTMSAPQIVTPRGPGAQRTSATWGDSDGGLGTYVVAWQDTDVTIDPEDGQDAAVVRVFDGATRHWQDMAIGPRVIMNGGLGSNTPVHCLRMTSGRILVVYCCFNPAEDRPEIRGRVYDPVTGGWSPDTVLAEGLSAFSDWSNWPMYATAGRTATDEIHLLVYDDPRVGVDPDDYRDTMFHTTITEVVDDGSISVFNPKSPSGEITLLGRLYRTVSSVLVQEDEATGTFKKPLGIGANDAGWLIVFYHEKRTIDDKYDRMMHMTQIPHEAWSTATQLRDWQDLYGDPGPPPVVGFLGCNGVHVRSTGSSFHAVWDERRIGLAPGDGNSDIFHATFALYQLGDELVGGVQVEQLNAVHSVDDNSYEDMLPKIAIGEMSGDIFVVWQDTTPVVSTAEGPVGAVWSMLTRFVVETEDEPVEGCLSVPCGPTPSGVAPDALETQEFEVVGIGSGERTTGWVVP